MGAPLTMTMMKVLNENSNILMRPLSRIIATVVTAPSEGKKINPQH